MKRLSKIVIILICLFFITGCTAEYDVSLIGDKLNEKLTLKETNTEIYDEETSSGLTVRDMFNILFQEDQYGKEEYKVKKLDENILSAELKSNKLTFETSPIISTCYPDISITESNEIITIDTGDNFQCYDIYDNLEEVTVKFKTDHKITSHNANSKTKGTYVWNLTKGGSKRIVISYSTKSPIKYIPIIIFFVGVVIVLGVAVLFIKNKRREVNKI